MIFSKFSKETNGGSTQIATLVFVLLIGFLSFYVNNARTQINNILKIDEYLHQLLFLNKNADIFLEKDMKFYNYDSFEKLSLNIINTQKSIKILSLQNSLENQDLKQQIDIISKLLDKKFDLLEDFKSTNAVLNNSYRYIMNLSKSLEVDEDNEKYNKELHNILIKVLSLSNDISINIDNQIKQIEHLQKLEVSKNNINEYFLLHSKLVLQYYKKFTHIRTSNKNLSLEDKIQQLIFNYNSYNTKLINNISFIIALLIFIIIVFLLLFLRFGYKLEITVKKRTKELNDLNSNLEKRIKEETAKNISQEKQLTQQSRSAAMGEMMGAIIHQWKQPLNTLSVANSSLQLSMMIGNNISKDELEKTSQIIETQIDHMNTTMEDFKNFFKPQTLREYNINDSVNDVINLIGKIYKTNNVFIQIDLSNGILTEGYPNELNQVIINILNNARDIIVEKDCEVRDVYIKTFKENDKAIITITDCAGGVPEDIIDKIFDPYVTTKSDDKGTGIGLDMSKTIIEKVNGDLSVKNVSIKIDNKNYIGAQFRIELKSI